MAELSGAAHSGFHPHRHPAAPADDQANHPHSPAHGRRHRVDNRDRALRAHIVGFQHQRVAAVASPDRRGCGGRQQPAPVPPDCPAVAGPAAALAAGSSLPSAPGSCRWPGMLLECGRHRCADIGQLADVAASRAGTRRQTGSRRCIGRAGHRACFCRSSLIPGTSESGIWPARPRRRRPEPGRERGTDPPARDPQERPIRPGIAAWPGRQAGRLADVFPAAGPHAENVKGRAADFW